MYYDSLLYISLIHEQSIFYLYTVVITLAEKGFQPHLEEFILRLNYNCFYQT